MNAINLISAQTGVRAVDTGDLKKGVALIADDGRNITLALKTLTTAATGLGSPNVYTGSYQLTSTSGAPITLASSSSGTIANAGVAVGTFQANVSTVTSVARTAISVAPSNANAGVLNAGTMRINGIAIDAAVSASDTASDVTATGSTKAAPARGVSAAAPKTPHPRCRPMRPPPQAAAGSSVGLRATTRHRPAAAKPPTPQTPNASRRSQ